MSAPTPGNDKNRELMRAMGSKTGRYDPEPPEQWRWQLANGSPAERAFAWVKWKTTGHPTFETRSPFCVSEAGTPLYFEHAAADLGWKYEYTRHVFAELEQAGRVRLEKGKRIWNRADVPAVQAPAAEAANGSVHNRWSPYLLDSIRNLPAEKRELFDTIEAEFLEWHDRGFSEMVAAWRLMVEPVENIMFERVGIEKKRLPKKEREEPPVVQLSLLSVPGFVQNGTAESVQSAIEFVQTAKPTSHRVKGGSHKAPAAAASLLPLSQAQDSTGRSVGQSSEEDRPADLIPFPTEMKREDTLIESIERLLIDEKLGEEPSHSLCLQIADRLKGAPLEHLQAKMRRPRQRAKLIEGGLGLARSLAAEAGRDWQRDAAARQRAVDARAAHDAHSSEQARQMAQKTLNDPRAGPEEKKLAREILGDSKTTGGGR